MSKKSVILSSKGLKNIVNQEEEFVFIFGERELHMNNIFAEFLSPLVSHLHHFDPTIDIFHYNFEQKRMKALITELFTDETLFYLRELSSGSSIEIDSNNARKILQISIFLCNDELYTAMDNLYPQETDLIINDIDQILQELEIFEETNKIINNNKFLNSQSYSKRITNIASFLSKNVESIEYTKFRNLSKKTLFSIISNEEIRFDKEDNLIEFIFDIFSNDDENEEEPDIISFFEKDEFDKISENKFIEFILKLNPEKITHTLWNKICYRFCHYKKEPNKNLDVKNFLFDGNEKHRFEGIISHLSKECGGNVHDKNVVEITASSIYMNKYLAKYASYFNDNNHLFFSDNNENSWLLYDFKNRKVRPTDYTIRSRPRSKDNDHPRSWIIEGSNDKVHWKTLDSHKDVDYLCEKNLSRTFKIQENLEPDKFFQYLRIRQTGKNSRGNDYFGFEALEYFGSIIINK